MKQKEGIILIVDDEREHADGIAEALEKFCTKAIAVYNGKDALEIVRNRQIDIVITDLKSEELTLDKLKIKFSFSFKSLFGSNSFPI